jgi:hypothetical protein
MVLLNWPQPDHPWIPAILAICAMHNSMTNVRVRTPC